MSQHPALRFFRNKVGLLAAEIAVVEPLEAAAMASFVLSHFVNGIVDGIEISLLGVGSDTHLVLVGTGFGQHALVEVGLGIPYAVAEELGELRSVLGLLEGVALECLGDFGITLAIGLTAHSQIHAHLGAFAHEMSIEVFDHLLGAAFGNADFVFGNELNGLFFGQFLKLAFGSAAERALFGSLIAFVNIATDGAYKFLLHKDKKLRFLNYFFNRQR